MDQTCGSLNSLYSRYESTLQEIIAEKKNSLASRNKSHISFICFRNVAFQSARRTGICILWRTMKMNESKSHTSVSRCRIDLTCWFILKRLLLESFLGLLLFRIHEGLMNTYVLKCYCRFKTRGTLHLNSAAQKGKSLKCCLNLKSLLWEMAVL